MSYETMRDASQDGRFMGRVLSCIQQESRSGALAATAFGVAIAQGMANPIQTVGWAVVVATEAAYAADPINGVTDAAILAAVQAAWPSTWPPVMPMQGLEVAAGQTPPPNVPVPPPVLYAAAGAAGSPGQFLPAEAPVPADLAAVQSASPAIVAQPSTAWTTGQSVNTTGGAIHWDGTAWVTGVAP